MAENNPKITKITTSEAPQAGPYSQGVSVSTIGNQRLLFVSGMLPIEPATGKLMEGDIRLLTRQVIMNLNAVLQAGGSHLHHVVRTDVFLKSLKDDFAGMNDEYAIWFSGRVAPARQTIQVAELPLGSRIEISCIALAIDLE